jgi:PAS domain S-box-containing protein
LEKEIAERKKVEEALQQKTHDLGERVKELNCLYGISNLVEIPDISLEEIFQGVVDIIPSSWQYPEITCSRIILEDEEYKTVNFKETGWKQSGEIFVTGKRMGTLEVFYLEERREIYEGPFLKEERHLIDEITDRLGIIIERKQTDEALQESDERYRVITDSALDAIIEIDLHGKVTHWNPSAEKMFGYTKGDIMEKVVHDYLMPDKFREQYAIGFEKFRETGTGPAVGQVLELTAIHKDGHEFPVEIAISPIKKLGQYWASGIIREITERKLAEEVSKKVDALETSNAVLKNFVGDALGNLISPIYSRIQMIIGIRDNIDEIKSDLKDTETGLAKFLTGINAFREYFRFGERPMKERISTDISHTLSTLLSGQVLETYGKDEFPIYPKIKLRFTYDPKQEEALGLKELPYVVGHEFDITTAIQETLINAIESYDPEKGGDVVISAKKEKDNLILEIADQGRGMSPDETEKSQLPFYKILGVKGSTRFGLGAYIANESAKHCGGDIYIESTEEVGTTASVLFKINSKPLVDM